MSTAALSEETFQGIRGEIRTYTWEAADPRYVAVIAHGYGEHARRYDHVAAALVADGAGVVALDHHGHGRSDGERASVSDPQDFIADLDTLVDRVRERHPGLPVVLIGHSMGGLIAARYAQQRAGKLAALVLSAPVIGGNEGFAQLLALDPIPVVPIDPSVLSRDPAVGEAYAADPLVYHGPFRRETLEALFIAVEATARGGEITLPTLWIHGEGDALAPLEATAPAAEAIGADRWEKKVYPGAMHEIFNETNRDEVIGDTIRFIDAALASR
jgi:alpha-beta hydrolase superfamily lysophospholipase